MASATLIETTDFPTQILNTRAVIRMAGERPLAFLQNILTCDLSSPKPAYGALLSPQGKILHDIFVVPDGDTVWIDVARTQADDLLKRLIMYRLRAKLDIVIDQTRAVLVSRNPERGFADPRCAAMGYRAIVSANTDTRDPQFAYDNYNDARISLGLADSVYDIGSGDLFVHEANLDQLNGVSFSKGCYVGQEVVSRTHHRNSARTRILPVTFDGTATHGTEIRAGEQRIGSMLSSVKGKGLALLRLDRLAEATAVLQAQNTKLRVHKPSWASFDLSIPEAAL